MQIGLIKERKTDENRVALEPQHVGQLVTAGHTVWVETEAGTNSGYPDDEYQAQGAKIVSVKQIVDQAQLLLKVKTPLQNEYEYLRPEHTLFTYLHLDENIPPSEMDKLIGRGFLGIAYEWVEVDGDYPLLAPMSYVTGYLFAMRACELLMHHKGILYGAYGTEEPRARAMIIGLGRIGTAALKFCLANRMAVVVVDKHPETLNARINTSQGTEGVDYLAQHRIEVIRFDMQRPHESKAAVAEVLPRTDILLNCAVRRADLPKSKLEYLVDEAMIKTMARGSIACDTSACDKDLLETCISSPSLQEISIVHNVVHYNCDHIPSYVGRSATALLTAATFPYVSKMADLGVEQALRTNAALRAGASCHRGKITHRYTAEKKGYPYTPILELL